MSAPIPIKSRKSNGDNPISSSLKLDSHAAAANSDLGASFKELNLLTTSGPSAGSISNSLDNPMSMSSALAATGESSSEETSSSFAALVGSAPRSSSRSHKSKKSRRHHHGTSSAVLSSSSTTSAASSTSSSSATNASRGQNAHAQQPPRRASSSPRRKTQSSVPAAATAPAADKSSAAGDVESILNNAGFPSSPMISITDNLVDIDHGKKSNISIEIGEEGEHSFPPGTLFHHWATMSESELECVPSASPSSSSSSSSSAVDSHGKKPGVSGSRKFSSALKRKGSGGGGGDGSFGGNSSKTRTFSTGVKLVIEQYYENFFRSREERAERLKVLSTKMNKLELSDQEKANKYSQLARRETEYMRSRRIRLTGNKFESINIIGRGAFGEVRLVKMVGSNYLYAMKKLRKTKIVEMNQVAHVRAERDALADNNYFYNKNPWVVSLYYSFQDTNYLYLIMEYVPGGDLMNLLIKLGTFPEDMARFYIAEIMLAIDSIHQLHYIHRDIKPDNILLDRNGHVKLSDFGLCTGLDAKQHKIQMYKKLQMQAAREADSSILLADGQMSRQERFESWSKKRKTLAFSNVGTPDYMAPEIIFEEGYNHACDYWSVGVIMFEMLVGYPPFYAETQREIRQKIMEWRKYVQVPDGVEVSEEAKLVLSRLLCDQSVRLDRSRLEENAWFHGISWRSIRKKGAPVVPKLTSPTDTSYFDKFDEEDESKLYAPARDTLRRFYSQDIPFIGYTYRNFRAVR